jgi:misacylated tRNA(Ala) deacylase
MEIYKTDSYINQIQTKIVQYLPDKKLVMLEDTCIYPGGGGQGRDDAEILIKGVPYKVIDIQDVDGKNWYRLDCDYMEKDVTVLCKINWDRRYALMRTHTAMHIVCGVMWRDYKKYVTGSNMDILKGRLDYDFSELKNSMINEIEDKLNHEVAMEREVKVSFNNKDNIDEISRFIRTKENLMPSYLDKIRFVEIVGLDMQTDGGTHVNNTKEVGKIKVIGIENKGKNNKRIKFELE